MCIKDEVISLASQKSSLSILNAAGFLCTYLDLHSMHKYTGSTHWESTVNLQRVACEQVALRAAHGEWKRAHFVCDWHRVLMTTDLPPPVGPTIMVVWRVSMVSYIWTTLSTCNHTDHLYPMQNKTAPVKDTSPSWLQFPLQKKRKIWPW